MFLHIKPNLPRTRVHCIRKNTIVDVFIIIIFDHWQTQQACNFICNWQCIDVHCLPDPFLFYWNEFNRVWRFFSLFMHKKTWFTACLFKEKICWGNGWRENCKSNIYWVRFFIFGVNLDIKRTTKKCTIPLKIRVYVTLNFIGKRLRGSTYFVVDYKGKNLKVNRL